MASKFFDRSQPDREQTLSAAELAEARPGSAEQEHTDGAAMGTPGFFEGDMKDLSIGKLASFFSPPQQAATSRQMTYRTWPDGVVPFTISSRYTAAGRRAIAEALNELASVSCVRFVPKQRRDANYVHIVPEYGCYSSVGMIGGRQNVSLGAGCLSRGIIQHELMHALGFFHEQRRLDRDAHVTVDWNNVRAALKGNLETYAVPPVDALSLPYDTQSLMHLGPYAFSEAGKTLRARYGGAPIGQLRGLSATDRLRLNKLYNCTAAGARTTAHARFPSYSASPAAQLVARGLAKLNETVAHMCAQNLTHEERALLLRELRNVIESCGRTVPLK